jgi:protein-S-isoprenylcysteine O-methyltransferase Ste14
MSLFAIQHSVMARQPFKKWFTQFVPKSVERTTYVLLASLLLVLLFWQWRPLPAVVWHIENLQIAMTVTGLSFIGWLTVLSSTFLLNHFELFGLHQVANNLAGKPMPAPRFRTPLYYKFVRHPLYLGLSRCLRPNDMGTCCLQQSPRLTSSSAYSLQRVN